MLDKLHRVVWEGAKVDWSFTRCFIRSATECGMFIVAGCFISSASFLYQVGGGNEGNGLEGWYMLGYVLSALVLLMAVILVVDMCIERRSLPPTTHVAHDRPPSLTPKSHSSDEEAALPSE